MELKGKKALVTGAAVRIGREIARVLASRGVEIWLHYNRSRVDAEKTASEIRAMGVPCSLFQADLSATDSLLRMAAAVENAGGADILVNSASIFYKTPIQTVTEADFDAFIDANLKGPFTLSRLLGNAMAARKGGKIVNIADWSGFRPYRDFIPYCVSKGGLLTLTKALARDLAPHVHVNTVAPGPVLPPPDMSDKEKEAVVKKTLVGRWGSPADVAHAAAFLLENDFINGTVLVVDGGRSMA
jgi:NAD(P)-dependent dehydrogenase (short-subunit alcohol dehydrogenase family)